MKRGSPQRWAWVVMCSHKNDARSRQTGRIYLTRQGAEAHVRSMRETWETLDLHWLKTQGILGRRIFWVVRLLRDDPAIQGAAPEDPT